ncbi:Probable protein phosphatase 2C 23 [Dionaea muscipula]
MKGILNAISGIGNRVKGLEWGNEMSKSSGKLSSTPHSSQVSLDIDHTGCYYVAGNGNHHHIQEQEQEQEMSENLQWAQGKAGEDRVHVVVSEDYGWIFVGIYDGFNGPDAPDFLLSNLYSAVHKELLCLLGGTSVVVDESEAEAETALLEERINSSANSSTRYSDQMENAGWESTGDVEKAEKKKKTTTTQRGGGGRGGGGGLNGLEQQHDDVLKALSEALRKTEEAYFEMAEKMALQNPELFMMGSCVLVTLMMGEDVYLMNVGDSRAVIGQLKDVRDHHHHHHIRIHENNNDSFDDWLWLSITPLQLTVDHNTHVKEEVQRIRKEHLDDPSAVANDCVKCSLKVTRAFGAGFLKQPKWNEGLLEMFRIEYVGSSPYITCWPSLRHHKLGPRDKFLILSSDGLYQYFTNQEAVSHVEMFMSTTPEGDPAQHLIEEVLFRAAKKAGIDFHELLDIPQGERRRYHDDVSIIVISLEGTIWRSSA